MYTQCMSRAAQVGQRSAVSPSRPTHWHKMRYAQHVARASRVDARRASPKEDARLYRRPTGAYRLRGAGYTVSGACGTPCSFTASDLPRTRMFSISTMTEKAIAM